MTLDEAIKHCLDIADGQDKCADISVSEHAKERIRECANDHRQLVEWLTELKKRRESDVQPVKRGRWIETHISLCKWIPEDEKEEGQSFYMAEMKCSCCERYNTVTFALTLNKPDFCQLCGARMIKDGDTE